MDFPRIRFASNFDQEHVSQLVNYVLDTTTRLFLLNILDFLLNGTMELLWLKFWDLNSWELTWIEGSFGMVNATLLFSAQPEADELGGAKQVLSLRSTADIVSVTLFAVDRVGLRQAVWGSLSWVSYLKGLALYWSCALLLLTLLFLSRRQLYILARSIYPLVLVSIGYAVNILFISRFGDSSPSLSLLWFRFGEYDDSIRVSVVTFLWSATVFFLVEYLLHCALTRVRGASQIASTVFHLSVICTLLGTLVNTAPDIMVRVIRTAYFPLFLRELCSVAQRLPRVIARTRMLIRGELLLIQQVGLHEVIVQAWADFQIPTLFRTFWLTKLLFYWTFIVSSWWNVSFEASNRIFALPDEHSMLRFLQYLLVRSCETLLMVFGGATMLAKVGKHLLAYVHWFLTAQRQAMADDVDNFGIVLGILFFTLAFQSGITGLKTEERLIRLIRNFWLLLTALLHLVQQMTHKTLMRLSAANALVVSHHLRALVVECLLLMASCWLALHTYLNAPLLMNPWVISLLVFAAEVAIKAATSLALYTLLLVSTRTENDRLWEQADFYVHRLKVMRATMEFVCSLVVFFSGIWILLSERGGIVRALMIGLHGYVNLWKQGSKGWSAYRRRRSAAARVNRLRNASFQTLEQLNDVCSICIQTMAAAKITVCGHYFHANCLRKWLYIQDTCPLCHKNAFEEPVPTS